MSQINLPEHELVNLERQNLAFNEMAANMQLLRQALLLQDGNRFNTLRLECGYPETVSFTDYLYMYRRSAVGRRVITSHVDAAWQFTPTITEDSDATKDTPFETAVLALVDEVDLWKHCKAVDRMSGVGEYAVLFLGFDDVKSENDLKVEVKKGAGLLFLQSYWQNQAEVKTRDTDQSSPRFGLPLLYELTAVSSQVSPTKQGGIAQTSKLEVHWSRIIHVAYDTDADPLTGTPKMKCVFNDLLDLFKVSGGSAEMYYRGGFPGYIFNMGEGATVGVEEMDDMREQITNYMNSMQRYLRLQNVKVDSLTPQVADPKNQQDAIFSLISAGTGIPKRILTGSEQAQLASTQDRSNWSDRVIDYRNGFVIPCIINPLLDRLIAYGILPASDLYRVVFKSPFATDPQKLAETAETIVKAMAAFISGGVETLLSPKDFFVMLLDKEPDEVDAILDRAAEFETAAIAQEEKEDVEQDEDEEE